MAGIIMMRELIQGRYRILDKLGAGGNGQVYRAYDTRLEKSVAVKFISCGTEEWKREEARKEVCMLTSLDCAGIPGVLDFFCNGGGSVIVMDYIEGESLERYIDRKGPMEERDALRTAGELLGLLEQLHRRNILFLDLKPSNIMVDIHGGLRLVDFGSAVYKGNGDRDYRRSGTYGYAAPELLAGETVDERADIYSFGATLYYILTGVSPAKPPYEIRPVSDWNSVIPHRYDAFIQGCLSKDRDTRYCGTQSLKQALEGNGEKERRSLFMRIKDWSGRKRQVLLRQEKNIYCSGKKGAGLLCMLPPMFFLLGILLPGLPSIAGRAAENKLFVNVRDEIGQKLLIQEGAVYYTKGSMIFEIPEKEFIPGTEYEIKIICAQDGQARDRIFHVIRREEGRCTESIPGK